MEHSRADQDAIWIHEQHEAVIAYLERQGIDHGGLPETPEWFVSPYIAIWKVMSPKAPGAVGWWAISGDLPTDYASSSGIHGARDAAQHFANSWRKLASDLAAGRQDPETTVGTGDAALSEPLRTRAEMLAWIAKDDDYW